jgi:hypothetical protein
MSQIAVYEEQGTRFEVQGERQKQKKLRLILESGKAADSDVMLVTTHRIPRAPPTDACHATATRYSRCNPFDARPVPPE